MRSQLRKQLHRIHIVAHVRDELVCQDSWNVYGFHVSLAAASVPVNIHRPFCTSSGFTALCTIPSLMTILMACKCAPWHKNSLDVWMRLNTGFDRLVGPFYCLVVPACKIHFHFRGFGLLWTRHTVISCKISAKVICQQMNLRHQCWL